MSAIDETFQSLRQADRKAFIPFVTAGDPDLEFTADILPRLADAGAAICEVGIPYSDPIADGPVIQASYTRALDRKIKLNEIIDMLARATPRTSCPVVTMVSYAIVHRYGARQFVADVKSAGVAGAIVPDLLVDEAEEFKQICDAADFSLIQLVSPATPRDRAVRIAANSSGFLYYVSVMGITGERRELPPQLLEDVSWLRSRAQLPVCIGFGISTAEHVRQLAPVADGLIVGSAIVRRVEALADRPREECLGQLSDYVREMVAAFG
ncbi:MAG: tryptophan synthase subunit alpha [Pirellulales bacterium]|nr:tryptophan synthase subunit alpha [Pirellulales bacterium]